MRRGSQGIIKKNDVRLMRRVERRIHGLTDKHGNVDGEARRPQGQRKKAKKIHVLVDEYATYVFR